LSACLSQDRCTSLALSLREKFFVTMLLRSIALLSLEPSRIAGRAAHGVGAAPPSRETRRGRRAELAAAARRRCAHERSAEGHEAGFLRQE
jgi:hypothetical protein